MGGHGEWGQDGAGLENNHEMRFIKMRLKNNTKEKVVESIHFTTGQVHPCPDRRD